MTSSLTQPQVQKVLGKLYDDARTNDPLHWQRLKEQGGTPTSSPLARFQAMKDVYMPVDQEFGNLLYAFTRSSNAKTVVEFGTSFGISTIFLAAGVRDNGGGRVITTEFIPEKAERAKKNLAEAGLIEFVEFRIGDALESLKPKLAASIDLVFLDGAKDLYHPVLKLIEPQFRPGTVVIGDNTNHTGLENFLEHVRTPNNNYVSSAIFTRSMEGAHEVAIRC